MMKMSIAWPLIAALLTTAALSVRACVGRITTSASLVPRAAPTFERGENAVVFVGHATTLIHLDGATILTDPNFNDRVMFLRRSRAPGLGIDALPPLDAVLISHAHRDHLDFRTLERLPREVVILIAKGNGHYLRERGFTRVHEVEAGRLTRIGRIDVIAVPVAHSGARNSASATWPRAFSYIVRGEKSVYFAGDTGPSPAFSEIGRAYRIDVALLPIGAYRPRWFMKDHHLSPADALHAFAMLRARHLIPIHWGSFRMAFDAVDEPREVLQNLLEHDPVRERVHVLPNGGRYRF